METGGFLWWLAARRRSERRWEADGGVDDKGPFINYGEGGGATQWENPKSPRLFESPPAQDRVKLVAPPVLKG